jgi:hypothetical protein
MKKSRAENSVYFVYLTLYSVCCWFLVSEEEAKKRIYNVSCERYLGFGCEIDEETSTKLEGLFT